MTKLNGWKRLGIIASFVWMFVGVGYSLQNNDRFNASAIQEAVRIELQCENDSGTDFAAREACIQRSDEFVAMLSSPAAMTAMREDAAFWAFAPLPFAWGFVFMVFGLGRWVKRGFATTTVPDPQP